MIHTSPAPVKPTPVQIRVLDEYALVPSAKGNGRCYHVAHNGKKATGCECAARQFVRDEPCKHMLATNNALFCQRVTGRDTFYLGLTPQRFTKPAPKPAPKAPSLASLYATAPAPARTPAEMTGLAAHFAKAQADHAAITNTVRAERMAAEAMAGEVDDFDPGMSDDGPDTDSALYGWFHAA